jgi:dienelactone hydrolase
MRRLFIAASLILGTLGAVAFGRAAFAENVTIPAAGGVPPLSGYLSRPRAPGPAPAVLVLHGCEGFGPLENATVDDLAAHGYVGLAIDVNKAAGVSSACADVRRISVIGGAYGVAALAWLASQPYVNPSQLGVMGFSMGGIEVLNIVDPFSPSPAPPGLRAAVAYYPACNSRPMSVAVPLLMLNGDGDDYIPYAPCQAFAAAAAAAGKPVQITTYPGATHAFNQPSNGPRHFQGHTFIYDPKASADANAKTMAFFAQYLH